MPHTQPAQYNKNDSATINKTILRKGPSFKNPLEKFITIYFLIFCFLLTIYIKNKTVNEQEIPIKKELMCFSGYSLNITIVMKYIIPKMKIIFFFINKGI